MEILQEDQGNIVLENVLLWTFTQIAKFVTDLDFAVTALHSSPSYYIMI